jgi:putative transposase
MELYNLVSKSESYYDFGHTTIAGQVLRDVYSIWKSYVLSLKAYKKSRDSFKGLPKPPRYKHKEKDRFQVCYTLSGTAQPINKHYKISKKINFLGKEKEQINLPKLLDDKNIKELVITPTINGYSIVFNYEETKEKLDLGKNKIAAIDLGLNNLCTLTFNNGKNPKIYSGKDIKTINQFYNKRTSILKSKLPNNRKLSNKIKKITKSRNNQINDRIHKITRNIVESLIKENVGKLIVGNNQDWKQDINIGKRNNQNFVSIPHSKIIFQLKYKFEELGGEVITTEESYTSKASFLDLDFIPTYEKNIKCDTKFSGRRVRRLYKRNNGMILNADVNGSYNIMRKADPNAIRQGNLEDLKVNPLMIYFEKDGSIKNNISLHSVAQLY